MIQLHDFYDELETPDLVGVCRVYAAGEDITDRCTSAQITNPDQGLGQAVCFVLGWDGSPVRDVWGMSVYEVIFGDLRIEQETGVDTPAPGSLACKKLAQPIG